jgi:hypothetical protein
MPTLITYYLADMAIALLLQHHTPAGSSQIASIISLSLVCVGFDLGLGERESHQEVELWVSKGFIALYCCLEAQRKRPALWSHPKMYLV